MGVEARIDYEAVIGLEVHAQLLTDTKLFCACRAEFGAPPNSLTCPVCLGHPGALPVLNRKAAEFAIRLILAVGGEVRPRSEFARKNYFYPDLPKGYQISQYDLPIGVGGKIRVDGDKGLREINLSRIHLEEDAGKLLHPDDAGDKSLIDFNRCGVPLLEIVTEPEISTPREAHSLLINLRRILQYLGICSGDMEKGALRCDANVSIRRRGYGAPGARVELKNLNSFRYIEKAVAYEINRQTVVVEKGGEVIQETRLWDERRQRSAAMRGKEESEDYRYFPEPDLLPLKIDNDLIEKIKTRLPELPDAKKERFINRYGITSCDAAVLTESAALADYFEAAAQIVTDGKLAANWVMVEVLRVLNERKIEIGDFLISPNRLGELLCRLKSNIISGKMAKEIFEEMAATGRSATAVMEEKGMMQIVGHDQLEAIIEQVLSENKALVQKYKSGKIGIFDFLVGQVMKTTSGRAHPQRVNRILREKLDD